MKRDMDLVVKILEVAEFCFPDSETPIGPLFDNRDPMEIRYHLELLSKGGFLKTSKKNYGDLHGLTWAGHDLLDSLRAQGFGKTDESSDSAESK